MSTGEDQVQDKDAAFVVTIDEEDHRLSITPSSEAMAAEFTIPVQTVNNNEPPSQDASELQEEVVDEVKDTKLPAEDLEEEPISHKEAKIVLIFWIVLVTAGTVLGIIYFAVKVGKSDCHDGTALPGDVTAPDNPNFGEVLSIIWSFLPYACGIALVVELFRRRNVWPLHMLLLAGLIVVINEGFFKRVISQDRPSGSCLESKGMPSSHAELSIGFWWYFHLECILKENLTSTHAWTAQDKLMVMGFVYVVLLPVPFTRVVLEDHSWAQVGVGALVGSCVGTCWFFFMDKWMYKYLDKVADVLGKCKCCWGHGLFHHFVNDFSPLPDQAHISHHQTKLRKDRCLGESCGEDSAQAGDTKATDVDTGNMSVEVPGMGTTDKVTQF